MSGETLALIRVLSDLLITVSFTLSRINRMTDEEAKLARKKAEDLSDQLIGQLGPRNG